MNIFVIAGWEEKVLFAMQGIRPEVLCLSMSVFLQWCFVKALASIPLAPPQKWLETRGVALQNQSPFLKGLCLSM